MKNKKIKDERISQMQNKILGEAYFVVLFLLSISILIKAFVMDEHYTTFISELGAIVLSTIYFAVRSMMMGNILIDISKRYKTLCIFGTLGASIIITFFNGIKNYADYGEQYSGVFDLHYLAALAVTFLSSLILISVGLLFIFLCHKKGQQKIDKKLAEEETEED